jgi:predicted PurR-regulated permease PerM
MEDQSPSELNNWTFRRVMLATLILVCVGLGFWLLYRFYQVIFILFVAIILGTVIRPIVNWLNTKGLPRFAGVLFVYFLAVALFIGFIFLLFPLVFAQGSAIVKLIPDYYQNFLSWIGNSPNHLIASLKQFLPTVIPGFEAVSKSAPEELASAEQSLSYVATVSRVVFNAIVILLLAFHWTLDGPKTIQSLIFMLPHTHRENTAELIKAMETKVGYFIAGQGALCLIIGVMALIAYLIIGLPNALVLALVAGALEAVPMVGPILGAIPAALIALSISPSKLIWVIVATEIIQVSENNFLVPRIMRKAVGSNPFVSLLAIFSFSSLFGIPGALMAIPIAAIIQLLLDHFIFQKSAAEPEDATGRDFASRLRYEAKDLVQGLRKQARLKKGGAIFQVKQVDKVMDEIEAIAADLNDLLAQIPSTGNHD